MSIPKVESARLTSRRQQWTLGVACTATFMLMLDVTVANIALPLIRTEFDADLSSQQWIIAAYTLPLAALLLAAGSLGDELGRKHVFIAGLIAFSIGSLVAGTGSNLITLELARAVQGVGGAILFAISPALIAQEFGPEQRGKAFGIFGAITGLALALGPVVGGILANLDWRWIFLVNVPIGIILGVVTHRQLVNVRASRQTRPDFVGMLLFCAALFAIVFAIIRSETEGWSALDVLAPLIGGAVLLVAFGFVERSIGSRAMFEISLLRNRTFLGLSVSTFISNATSLAALFLMVSYIQNVLGYSALASGLILLPLTLVLFAVAAIVGGLVDKVSPRLLLGTSIALIGVGIMLLATVGPTSGWPSLLPTMVVMGLGMGMFNPPRSVLMVGVAPTEKAGMASGIGETFQQVGVVTGIAVFGALFQHDVVGRADTADNGRAVAGGDIASLPTELTQAGRQWFAEGLHFSMLACGAICVVGALVAFTTIRTSDLHTTSPSD